jgi:predicted HNH restriction endonuclease
LYQKYARKKFGYPVNRMFYENDEERKKGTKLLLDYHNRLRYNRDRYLIIQILGMKCKLCGIDDIDVLQIDHINNDGYLHRKMVTPQGQRTGRKTRSELLSDHKNGVDLNKTLQILCANCNYKKELYRRELEALERRNISPF